MPMSDQALNRALLARQGLIERHRRPLAEVVESVGALQAQHWPAVAQGLWTRVDGLTTGDLYAALGRGELLLGTSLRRTLHLTSAREHAAYAAAADGAGVNEWRRAKAEPTARAGELRAELLRHTSRQARTGDQIAEFVEDWIKRHPDTFDAAEADAQRQYRWRAFYTWSALVRAPEDGEWSGRAPAAFRTAPCPPGSDRAPSPDDALADVVRRHLRAFGPAAAEDVAAWTGWRVPPVRAALERLSSELERFTDGAGRTLYDVPDGPRPEAGTEVPARLLPAFDSTLLAYTPKHRGRILPDDVKDRVYARANLQIKPTVLVDGVVAGLWKINATKRTATMTVTAFRRLDKKTRGAVEAEAGELLRFDQPDVPQHRVVFDEG
ncbi:winged helix DNA-binding domain-containing protein [Micromonospora tulbaghiae]|nr:winged helix DNA-binding domain-containing protein [Micromonospora tulbaghiae]MDX5459247.1 winged helix DNA-binding domain-containing protein [Micromonospora tulbaghiae]